MNFPQQTKIVFSENDITKSIKTLASQISDQLQQENPIVISILNGGLMFTGELLKHLSFPLQQDYLHATRYGDELKGSDLLWKAEPCIDLENRVILLLDDIFDEGKTLEAVHKYCLSKKAKKVYSAVLVKKIKPRATNYEPNFFALEEKNDDYLFGMGMDVKGYWRNLKDIHALV